MLHLSKTCHISESLPLLEGLGRLAAETSAPVQSHIRESLDEVFFAKGLHPEVSLCFAKALHPEMRLSLPAPCPCWRV